MLATYPLEVDVGKTSIGGLRVRSVEPMLAPVVNDPSPYLDIGKRLRALRAGMSPELSQKAWAEKHGFPQSRYNNWETGARRIPVDDAEKLCNLYGLTLDFLYRGRMDGLSETARKVF